MGDRAGLPRRRHCLLVNRYGTYSARAQGTRAATYRGSVAEISEVRVLRPLCDISRARHPSGMVGGRAA